LVKKSHSGDSTLDNARALWKLGLIDKRPTLKTEFTAAQKGYITKLTGKFAREIAKPEQYVFRKVDPAKATQLSKLNYNVANNRVAIRAPFGASVRIQKDRMVIDNIFERNTVFLTEKSFRQFADTSPPVSGDIESDDEDTYENDAQNYWRFSDGGDISSKMYATLDGAVKDIQTSGGLPKPKGNLNTGALPVFSQQKMSGFTGFNADEIRRARQDIIEMIPAGTVRKNGKVKGKRKTAKKRARRSS
jgi:hypothetical protein